MGVRGLAAGRLLAVSVAGMLALTGCGDAPDVGLRPEALAASASPSSPSGPTTLPGHLASVDWPDDETTITAVFAALPSELSGARMSDRFPDPEASGPASQGGSSVGYGRAGDPRILLGVDPGSGIASPVHEMALMVLGEGGPQGCVDADHSPLFDDLFELETRRELAEELQLITELSPAPGELNWVVCTGTYEGGIALAEEDWRYVAGWGDGEAYYFVRASSAAQRMAAVAALVAAVQQVQG